MSSTITSMSHRKSLITTGILISIPMEITISIPMVTIIIIPMKTTTVLCTDNPTKVMWNYLIFMTNLFNGSANKGGGKALAIKILFLPFKNLKYFTSGNLFTYEYFTLTFVGRYLYWFVTIFSKKRGNFSPKIGGEIFFQNLFPALALRKELGGCVRISPCLRVI